jgi:hypothetical protein
VVRGVERREGRIVVKLTPTYTGCPATLVIQLSVQAALVEALIVTQDHGRGINRQRMDLRNIIKGAAEVLVYMNGKTPHNKRRLKKT